MSKSHESLMKPDRTLANPYQGAAADEPRVTRCQVEVAFFRRSQLSARSLCRESRDASVHGYDGIITWSLGVGRQVSETQRIKPQRTPWASAAPLSKSFWSSTNGVVIPSILVSSILSIPIRSCLPARMAHGLPRSSQFLQVSPKRVKASPLSKREIIRRLGTSATQFYRLLDQKNYQKSVDQLLSLLHVLDCDVDLLVRPKGPSRTRAA